MSKGYVCGAAKGDLQFVLDCLQAEFGKEFVTEEVEGVFLVAVNGQSTASEREAMKYFVKGLKYAATH